MRIARVLGADELRPLFELRHHVYVEELAWLPPSGGQLVDEFDEVADNYAAYDEDGSVIGSVRVVPDGPLGLPLERCLPLNGYRDGRELTEISRLAVRSAHRSSRLGALLMKAAYQRCLSRKATHIMLDTYLDRDQAAPLYDRMGFVQVGGVYTDTFHLCEWPSATLALDIQQAHAQLPVHHPGLWRFFTATDEVIDHRDHI